VLGVSASERHNENNSNKRGDAESLAGGWIRHRQYHVAGLSPWSKKLIYARGMYFGSSVVTEDLYFSD